MIAALHVMCGGPYWGLARVGGGWSDAQRNRTPVPFRDLLLGIARTARPPAIETRTACDGRPTPPL
jgi:hypothetical protein